MACVGLEIGADSGFSIAILPCVPRIPAAAHSRHDVDDLADPENARNEARHLSILVTEGDDIAGGVTALHNFGLGDGVGKGRERQEEEGKGIVELHGFGFCF